MAGDKFNQRRFRGLRLPFFSLIQNFEKCHHEIKNWVAVFKTNLKNKCIEGRLSGSVG